MHDIRTGILLSIIVLLYPIHALHAETITLTATLSRETIYTGETVELQISILGGDDTDEPDITSLKKNFSVERLSPRTITSSRYTSINGKFSQVVTTKHIHHFQLRPTSTGTLSLGPFTLSKNGKTYHSNKLRLTVRAPQKSDRCFLELRASKNEIFPEEAIVLTLNIYIRKLSGRYADKEPYYVKQPPHLTVPWLEGIEGFDAEPINSKLEAYLVRSYQNGFRLNQYTTRSSDFFNSFFGGQDDARFRFPVKEVSRTNARGKRQPYYCYSLEGTYRADRVGEYTLPVASFKGYIATEKPDDTEPVPSSIYTISNPLTIRVIPIPKTNRPPSYTGAIGRNFSISASVTPKECLVGDPLTLTLTVKGDGKLDRILPLNLAEQPGYPENFKVFEDALSSRVENDEKIFTHAIRPSRADISELPAIQFAYFDLDTRSYQIIRTKALRLKVSPSEEVTPELNFASGQSRISAMDHGLLPIAVSPQALHDQRFSPTDPLWAWIAGGIFPLCYFLALYWKSVRDRHRSNPVLTRKKQALTRAKENLRSAKAAQQSNDTTKAMEHLMNALLQMISDKCYGDERQLTSEEATSIIHRVSPHGSLAQDVSGLLQRCDLYRYSKQHQEDVAMLMQQAEQLITSIQQLTIP